MVCWLLCFATSVRKFDERFYFSAFFCKLLSVYVSVWYMRFKIKHFITIKSKWMPLPHKPNIPQSSRNKNAQKRTTDFNYLQNYSLVSWRTFAYKFNLLAWVRVSNLPKHKKNLYMGSGSLFCFVRQDTLTAQRYKSGPTFCFNEECLKLRLRVEIVP